MSLEILTLHVKKKVSLNTGVSGENVLAVISGTAEGGRGVGVSKYVTTVTNNSLFLQRASSTLAKLDAVKEFTVASQVYLPPCDC